MKTKTLLAVLGAIVGLEVGLENIGSVKRDCETYQGYTQSDSDISIAYVFDPDKAYSRSGFPEYILQGNLALKNSLKIGERYCFTFKDMVAPWSTKRIVSINQEPAIILGARENN